MANIDGGENLNEYGLLRAGEEHSEVKWLNVLGAVQGINDGKRVGGQGTMEEQVMDWGLGIGSK